MADELRLTGGFATAMARLPHYFTPFQAYVVGEAEKAEGRFDFRVALEILQREAEYRAAGASPQGIFLYQFEALCRNRLGYDRGLDAVAADPIYDERLAGVDFDGPPAGRPGRFRRHDLRAQRVVSQDAEEGREGDSLRREGRADRAGQPPQRPAISVFGAAAAVGLSERAAAAARGHAAIHFCRPFSGGWNGWKRVSRCWRKSFAAGSTWRGSTRGRRRASDKKPRPLVAPPEPRSPTAIRGATNGRGFMVERKKEAHGVPARGLPARLAALWRPTCLFSFPVSPLLSSAAALFFISPARHLAEGGNIGGRGLSAGQLGCVAGAG